MHSIKLFIKIFVILHIVFLQQIALQNNAYSTSSLPKYIAHSNNKDIYLHKKLFPHKIKLNDNNDYIMQRLSNNINNVPNDNIKNFPLYDSLYYSSSNTIHLQNDSINIIHNFYNQQYTQRQQQKTVSFMQLGIQNFLSKDNTMIIVGGGNRFQLNKLQNSSIGYNTFYYCPILLQKFEIPHMINIGGEYCYKNILFIINSFCDIKKFIYSQYKSYNNNIQYPKTGYQICCYINIPYLSKVIGQIKIENLLYKKNVFQKKSNNFLLVLGIDYHPIPILGFNISNTFRKNKYDDSTCQISVDYQFNIPIIQQISSSNNNTCKTKKWDHLNFIPKPFIPQAIKNHDSNNEHTNHSLPCYNKKITGFPGETKIITINGYNNESIKWDAQNLIEQGGDIIFLKNHKYEICLPKNPVSTKNNIILSYTVQPTTGNNRIQQNIIILLEKFRKRNSISLNDHINTITPCEHNDLHLEMNEEDVTSNSDKNTKLLFTEKNIQKYNQTITDNNITITSNNSQNSKENCSIISLSNDITHGEVQNTITNSNSNIKSNFDHNSALPPPPPPLPSSFFVQTQISSDDCINDSSSKVLESTSQCESELYTNKITQLQTTKYKKNKITINNDLSNLLNIHKKTKFSSIGTQEHIEKLENSTKNRKKIGFLNSGNDMEKIFSRLQITQSSSSIDDDYKTDDSNSNDSYYP